MDDKVCMICNAHFYPFRHYITVVGKIVHATKSHSQSVTRCIIIFVPILAKDPLNVLNLVGRQTSSCDGNTRRLTENDLGCGKRFSRPDSLTTHAKIHSNVRPYLCQYENCGKAYYHLRSLRKHERTHEEQQQQQNESDAVEERNTTHAVPKSGDTQLDWMF